MSVRQTAEPEYGNWVSTKLIYSSIAVSIPFFALSLVSLIFVVGAIPFLLSLAYFAYARYMFSQRGENLEAKLRNLVVEHLDWDGEGKGLDIGCGNAPIGNRAGKTISQCSPDRD